MPTSVLGSHTVFGLRKKNRRATDPQSNYYVDIYNSSWLIPLLLILILSLVDAVLTYFHVARGGEELNPIMRYVLELGAFAFFPYKYILTSMGIMVLCLHKNFTLVRTMVSLLVFLYILLAFYHVGILYAS